MTTIGEPLAGCVMVVTADRRKKELASALERRGATIQYAAALSTISHLDDERLIADTRALISNPPDIVVATTGIGFRGWVEAADAAGLAEDLLECLRGARVLARGPKARGAIQAAGLAADWVAQSETAAEVRDYLLAQGVAGLRIAVQHHGTGSDGLDEAFVSAGAQVHSLMIYGSGPPVDPAAHREWVQRAADGAADAVLFTSAPGAQEWLRTARELNVVEAVARRSVAGSLVMAAVGPVTARPLEDAGITVRYPDRWRLGALIRELMRHFGEDSAGTATASGPLVMRATMAVLDGRVLPLTPTELEVLRALVGAGGNILTREELADLLPGAHAGAQDVEAAINGLRNNDGCETIVRTALNRGYALGVPS